MKKALKIIGWILLILIAILAIAWFGFLRPKPPPISEEDRAEITVMPLPAQLKLGNGFLTLDESFVHELVGLKTPRLERAMDRFYEKLSLHTGLNLGEGDSYILTLVNTGNEMGYPSLEDDESYSLKISGNRIILQASMETGILYGLESLLQLIVQQDDQWAWPFLKMVDRPRYPWRGIMIDACRHWIPKEVILRNLDAMATLKMNVFHWHLSEYQGFRVESRKFPRLHEMGSDGDYYSQDDIRQVVEYAADRGIRVIPEFDLPGHSTSWFVGYPELASAPGPYTLDTIFGILEPVLDPTREEVYDFLDQFFGEMAELFPDEYVHIGGDEVSTAHWDQNPHIQDYMKEHDLEDAHALQAHLNIRLQQLLASHGKKMMGWDEILHPELPREDIAVQTWRDHGTLWESARMGNRAILSAGYYLDYKQSASYHYNIDPAFIPGAVDIEIDSTNWKGWDCTLEMSDMVMEGALYLFDSGAELRGIMNFMGGSMGFDEVITQGNRIAFTTKTNFGNLDFEVALEGDSLTGTAKLAMFTLELEGTRSGGTDMEGGKPLPEFRKIDPLTPGEEANLVGGEACIWSEMVDGFTIESRIWPRAAAIAEKLWSPQVLTDNVDDMYRRLMVMDDRLEKQGLKHRANSRLLTSRMVSDPYLLPLQELVSVLHEDEFFSRMSLYDPSLYTTTPLDRVVDAALPESYVVYRFGKDVEHWVESSDEEALDRITQSLETWAANHEKLAPAMEGSDYLKEVEPHSVHLSRLAQLSLEAINDPTSLSGRDAEIDTLLVRAGKTYGGTLLPLTDPVKKLVDAALEK